MPSRSSVIQTHTLTHVWNNNLGFSIFLKDTLTCRLEGLGIEQQPSDKYRTCSASGASLVNANANWPSYYFERVQLVKHEVTFTVKEPQETQCIWHHSQRWQQHQKCSPHLIFCIFWQLIGFKYCREWVNSQEQPRWWRVRWRAACKRLHTSILSGK